MTSARPSSSMTTRASKASPPIPPSDCGIARPRIPSSANSDQIWRSHPLPARAMARRRPGVRLREEPAQRVADLSLFFGESEIHGLEAQHVPHDDVALDLIGSGVDGGLAKVEVEAG